MGAALAGDDLARSSQATFRSIMTAIAYPGRIERVAGLESGGPLPACMGEVAQALCDYETSIWLDPALNCPAIVEWLRFRTGAPLVEKMGDASFAFVADGAGVPRLDRLAPGTDEYPDRSTTLVVAVHELANGEGMRLFGPGIKEEMRLRVGPLRNDLLAERGALAAVFPRGVDLIFVCGDRLAALPRTTHVEA